MLFEDEFGFLDTGFGEPQQVDGDDATLGRIAKIHRYMHNLRLASEGDVKDEEECLLHHKMCAYWATTGECAADSAYMAQWCSPACFWCNGEKNECPLANEPLPPDIWVPGSLNQMFSNIETHPYYQEKYKVQVISKPGMGPSLQEDAPWVIVIDDFLTTEETDTLIRLGGEQGYERSLEVGDNGVSNQRTSSNAWCVDECFEDETAQGVLQKIENLTAIPDSHGEYLQMLKYEEGQFYGKHHDYLDHHLKRRSGVRLVTVFLYLNDVEGGGGTRFTELDIVSALFL